MLLPKEKLLFGLKLKRPTGCFTLLLMYSWECTGWVGSQGRWFEVRSTTGFVTGGAEPKAVPWYEELQT